MRAPVFLVLAASVVSAWHPHHHEGPHHASSIVAVRLSGSACTPERRTTSPCCSGEREHLTNCCQNRLVCGHGFATGECDAERRLTVCCKTEADTCCNKACYITPHIKERDDEVEAEIKDDVACKGRHRNACCEAGESRCCRHCPLPFALIEQPAAVAAPPAPPPPPVARIPPAPAAPTPSVISPSPSKNSIPAPAAAAAAATNNVAAPGCAPAACSAARKMVAAKVDCSATTRMQTCCMNANDHLYNCCRPAVECQTQSRIGDMKMGRLCTDAIMSSTCCTVANTSCCKRCDVPLVTPLAIQGCSNPTVCCSQIQNSCCRSGC